MKKQVKNNQVMSRQRVREVWGGIHVGEGGERDAGFGSGRNREDRIAVFGTGLRDGKFSGAYVGHFL